MYVHVLTFTIANKSPILQDSVCNVLFAMSEVVTLSALPFIGVLFGEIEVFTNETSQVFKSSVTEKSYHTKVKGINSSRDDGK